jgi:crossover junction endodeoxyribonuclease RuvC
VHRILGIDPGSRVLGYAVVTSDGARLPRLGYVECGVVSADPGLPIERRLAEIGEGIRDVIHELGPDVVAIEDVFFGAGARSALALGQARGAALVMCGMAGLSVYAYPPAVVKQSVTGHGRATKEQVGHMVRSLLGLRRVPRPDAADALAVAVAHAHLRRDRDVRRVA